MQLESVNPQANLQGATLPKMHDFSDLARVLIESSSAKGAIVNPEKEELTVKNEFRSMLNQEFEAQGKNATSYFITGSDPSLEEAAYNDAMAVWTDEYQRTGVKPPIMPEREMFVEKTAYNLGDRVQTKIEEVAESVYPGGSQDPELMSRLQGYYQDVFVNEYQKDFIEAGQKYMDTVSQDQMEMEVNQMMVNGRHGDAIRRVEIESETRGLENKTEYITEIVKDSQHRTVTDTINQYWTDNNDNDLEKGWFDAGYLEAQLLDPEYKDAILAQYGGNGLSEEEYLAMVKENVARASAIFEDQLDGLDANSESLAAAFERDVTSKYAVWKVAPRTPGMRTWAIAELERINSSYGRRALHVEDGEKSRKMLYEMAGISTDQDSASKASTQRQADDALINFMSGRSTAEGYRKQLDSIMSTNSLGQTVMGDWGVLEPYYNVSSALSTSREMESMAKEAYKNDIPIGTIVDATQRVFDDYNEKGMEGSQQAYEMYLLEGGMEIDKGESPARANYKDVVTGQGTVFLQTSQDYDSYHQNNIEQGLHFSTENLDVPGTMILTPEIIKSLEDTYGEYSSDIVASMNANAQNRVEFVDRSGKYNTVVPTGKGEMHEYRPDNGPVENGYLYSAQQFVSSYQRLPNGKYSNDPTVLYKGEVSLYSSESNGVFRTRLVSVERDDNGEVISITPMDETIPIHASSDTLLNTTNYNGRQGQYDLPSGWNANMENELIWTKLNATAQGIEISDEHILMQLGARSKSGFNNEHAFDTELTDAEKEEIQEAEFERWQSQILTGPLPPGAAGAEFNVRTPEEVTKEIEDIRERGSRDERVTEENTQLYTPTGMSEYLRARRLDPESVGAESSHDALKSELTSGLISLRGKGDIWTRADARKILKRFDDLGIWERNQILNAVDDAVGFRREAQ